jgi:glutathionylspermidine synthase
VKRICFEPREKWRERCEEQGFRFHTLNGLQYWQETAGYSFSLAEIDRIESATSELHAMCLDLIRDIVEKGDYESYRLPNWVPTLIERSWSGEDPHLCGRFDLACDGRDIKLLEYNADTPTSLLEAAVIQWTWLEDNRLADQFNSIHEKLVARWTEIKTRWPFMKQVYFTTMRDAGPEDWAHISYLTETAFQARLDSSLIDLEAIGWDGKRYSFVDANDDPIGVCFKLYPWEWLVEDEFAQHIAYSSTRFIEPMWKMLLSSKAILPLLWQRHEDHPLLLPAYFDGDGSASAAMRGRWIRKPIAAREGANVSLLEDGVHQPLAGSSFNPAYDGAYVCQRWQALPEFDGWHPVIGSWVIGDEAAGIGIREDRGLVTGNLSLFVPHFIEE